MKTSTLDEAAVARLSDTPKYDDAKILYLDLEISPMLSYNYEAYDSNALKILVSPMIVSFAWQWEGETKISCMTVADYPGYKPGILKLNDKEIAKDLHEIMSSADIVIGHNCRQFDIPIARARFLFHGLPPTRPWQIIDTLKDFKKQFKFPKNNLDYLSGLLDGEGKTELKHSDLIWGCLEGDKKKWREMATYNKRDIKITYDLYQKTKGWYTNHPNLSFYTRHPSECPTCHSTKIVNQGVRMNRTGTKKRYSCRQCGRWFTGELLKDGYDKIKSY